MKGRVRKQQQSAMEFLLEQEMAQKQQMQMPVTGRVLGWLWAQITEAASTHVLPRIPTRVYVAGIVLAALLALVVVVDAFPRLRFAGMLAVGGGGALAGYWRARSRRWTYALGIGLGAAWALWAFAVAPVVGLIGASVVGVVYALIGIERRGEGDPGRLVREWRALTAPGEPLAAVLGGSHLHLEGPDGDKVSYTLTLRGGRTFDQVFKIRAAIESAVDEVLPVRRGSIELLADHDRPALVHMSIELFRGPDGVEQEAVPPTEGGEAKQP